MTSEQEKMLHDVAMDVALVKQAVVGNGVKGLNERMGDVETYIQGHPSICPFISGPSARKINRANMVFGIVGVIGIVGSLAVALFK
jgi:hypothetical protein